MDAIFQDTILWEKLKADRNVSLTWKFPTLYLGVSKYVLGPVKKIKRHFKGRKRCKAVLTLFKQKRSTFEKVSDSVQFSSLNQPQNSIKHKTHKPWAPTNAFFLSLNFFNSSKTTSRNLEGESFYIKTTKYRFLRTSKSKSNGKKRFFREYSAEIWTKEEIYLGYLALSR